MVLPASYVGYPLTATPEATVAETDSLLTRLARGARDERERRALDEQAAPGTSGRRRL